MDPSPSASPMRPLISVTAELEDSWTPPFVPELFHWSADSRRWITQTLLSADSLLFPENAIPSFYHSNKEMLPMINWTKIMLKRVLQYLYAKPLPIWDLYFTKEMWLELHRATYDLEAEFPVITFQEVIFILRILAHKDSVEWSIEMEDCLLERSGDVSDHNHVTEVLNETYGKDGANQITANDAYHKLVELRFSGKNGDIEVWSKEMEELLIALRDLGRDVDQITDEIFTLYNKPHLREDTQLKLLQMAHAKA
ncbi:MAG: hypothetical protein FRX48_03227 [Lasallia pustulata]|uniref:Uncharacterized protein n=1 Tax=Lasallia pustulata TaxID=136370 RepID=A0A5M8PWL3_9LECA|nr:MAG: hypothetical protein FRX48_03227 [Lasallia pustulata]